MNPADPPGDPDLLAQGGEMGARVRAFDWAATPLGPLDQWPSSLRTLVHMIVSSRHPMFLWWGPDLIQFYNDGYRPSLGTDRHPEALGARGEEFWGDIWPVVGPDVQQVMERGEAVWHENRLVPIVRNGRVEEVYWTYSYSPVLDDLGAIGGTLVTVQETTRHVLAGRRMSVLRTLAEHFATHATDVSDIGAVVDDVLAEAREDITFAPLYLFDESDTLQLGVALTIQDEGLGVPPANLESIFMPFGRAPNVIAANVPGLGLGLYLSRRIAEQHGGRLTAASRGEGHGTRMTLWLPNRPPHTPE